MTEQLTPPQPHEGQAYANGRVHVIERRTEQESGAQAPVVYLHGSAPHGRIEPTLDEIARLGRNAWAIEFTPERSLDPRFAVGKTAVRQLGDLEIVSRRAAISSSESGLLVPMQQLVDAQDLLSTIHEREEPVDMIAQSAGAGVAVLAAWLDAQRQSGELAAIRSLALVSPGGLLGHRPGGRVGTSFLDDWKAGRRSKPSSEASFLPANMPSYARAVVKQAGSKGFINDGYALKYGAMAPLLQAVVAQENPPNVSVFYAEQDGIFPMHELQAKLGAVGVREHLTEHSFPGAHAIRGNKKTLYDILSQLDG